MHCLLLLHLLPPQLFVVLHSHLLLLVRACMVMAHLCMLHVIRQPVVVRVPAGGSVPKVEFPVRPKICSLEVEAGVNFRPAGFVREQVVGHLPGWQPGTGRRKSVGGAATPSAHPEVPDTQFVSPGRGVGIRQSIGWERVCGSAESGIWVLKGDARVRKQPANLDHLRVQWRQRGSCETAWVTPGHDCLCSCAYGHGAAVRPQTNDSYRDEVFWFVEQGRTPLVREVPTGVNLNRYSGPG